MASTAEYLQQAAHNFSLSEFLRKDKEEYLDWAVTCLYYSAIHYVNAYLEKCGKTIPRRHRGYDPGGNPGRLDAVQHDPALRPIYANYRYLDDESRDARYELRKCSKDEYDKILIPKYERIKNCVLPKVIS